MVYNTHHEAKGSFHPDRDCGAFPVPLVMKPCKEGMIRNGNQKRISEFCV